MSRPEARGWEELLDDPTEPLYSVGVVAELMGVAPQVVRGYDERGLVEPDRAASGHRRYSRNDIQRLARAMRLSEDGIPTTGIERILDLEDELARRDDGGGGAAAHDPTAGGYHSRFG